MKRDFFAIPALMEAKHKLNPAEACRLNLQAKSVYRKDTPNDKPCRDLYWRIIKANYCRKNGEVSSWS
ncbi:MAG: hypothetical protein A4E55_00251 [Pelotomaculum sp. PtaU1.Bin035]|nr:MAG: hypothetical protein A4E55_00251 [Pelotomaculum sp. PtaU1.Bin035]